MDKDTTDCANDSRVTLNDMVKYIIWINKDERDAKPNPAHLTHWGLVTHICVTKQTIIGSDNGLSPGRRQAIIWPMLEYC